MVKQIKDAGSVACSARERPRTPICAGHTASAYGGSLQPLPLLLRCERLGELGQFAAENTVEIVRGVLDPVIGHAALGKVVGADLLGALATADLRLALGGDLGVLLGQLAP